MAILDSVLSLKQAINSVYGKNLVGMFKKPEMVITSVEFLYTLKKKEIISGMCEVIKNSLAISPKDINILMQKIKCDLNFDIPDYLYFIDSSIKAKTKVMNQDPYEKNMALVLEYGHTIGHAIELASKQQLTHGESIGIGMVYAAKISVDMGYLTQHDLNIHKVMLQKLGARTCVPKSVDKDTILGFIRHDNKRGYLKPNDEYVQMVLLKSLGTPVVHSDSIITMVKEDLIKCAIMYN
jgi:3-dehydroquinate synthase/2-deoxy-scyllo-inosose synthase